MYEAKVECRTCKFDKPARSKHCSMCDMCVEKFDHHCVWVNQCIGLRNYKYFLTFLFLHAWLCTYGFLAGVAIIIGIVDQERLWTASFTTADGRQIEANWWIILQYITQQHQAFVSVVLLCLAVAIMLHVFWIYHCWLVRVGLTTNEEAKRGSLKSFIR